MAQGFNGVYLDIIDAYEYYQDQGVSDAEEIMIDFVHNISIYTRNTAGSTFLIIPQNGEQLLENAIYRSYISGIGIEDLFYQNDGSKHTQLEIEQRESYLDLLVNENKLVLTVDYVLDLTKQEDVYNNSRTKGYIPYTTVLDLDVLTPPFTETNINSDDKSSYGFETTIILLTIMVFIQLKKIDSRNKR